MSNKKTLLGDAIDTIADILDLPTGATNQDVVDAVASMRDDWAKSRHEMYEAQRSWCQIYDLVMSQKKRLAISQCSCMRVGSLVIQKCKPCSMPPNDPS